VFAIALAAGANDRLRRNGILRALGFQSRQGTGLLFIENAPLAVAGVVAGTLTGIGIAALVLQTIDPVGFVGRPTAPPLIVDPLTLGVTVAGFLAAAVLAIAVALVLDTGRSSAAGLRTLGEER
ncbi:MAG: ABC transporter permease, partial [Leifsonia sp.]|nr:ABC transporter permease [Leifsonia sp.]